MINHWLMLAQEIEPPELPSTIWNLRNLILVIILIAIIVGYKIYKNKTMS